jgi:DNA polymerase I-like protein with 3'-5' exonuclease and polymerase domains
MTSVGVGPRRVWAVEQTVFGRLVQARPSKKAVEITDWNRFTALTNYRVSGSAADLLKTAIVRISEVMPRDCHLVATVHDELIFDAPVETAEFCRKMVEDKMREAFVEVFGD